jgi:hypothetical protein
MSIAPFSLVLRCCLQLALFLALSLTLSLAQAQVAKPAKRVALLIGNAAYPGAPNGERRLNNPVNDATLLAKVLKDELRFDQVTLLTDQKAEALDTAINRFIDQAASTPLDTIIVYFSGHGIYGADRHNYLLGIDANTGVPNAKALKWQGVRAAEVRDRLNGLKARVALLILDACRNGPGSRKAGDKGLRNMGSYDGLLVAYAAAEGEVADDGSGATGPYAAALAQAWRNTGLSILFQFAEVAREVREKTGGQQPTYEGTLHPGEALLPEQSEVVRRQHVADWDLCKTALTIAPCQQYRSKYPQGEYFVQAGIRRDDILAAQQRQAGNVAAGNDEIGWSIGSNPVATPIPTPVPVGKPGLQAGQVIKDCDVCPEMVLIPGGQFVMGDDKSDYSDEKPAHRVTIPGFLLGKFEVTQGQWRALMGSNPSRFKDCGDKCQVGGGVGKMRRRM